MAKERWTFTGHHFDHVEGHLFNPKDEQPFMITLTPNASCSQEELNQLGDRLAQLLNEADHD